MITAHCPHKVMIAGGYLVLDGFPAVAIACDPVVRLGLEARDEASGDAPPEAGRAPPDNPYVRAVFDAFGRTAAEAGHLQIGTARDLPVEGWGLGSSAALVTALTAATALRLGLPVDPASVFPIARRAHRAAQGGEGSGVDVAACCFGGAVVVRQAGGDSLPGVVPVPWPDPVAVLLVKTGRKVDTRARIASWRELQTRPGASGEEHRLLEITESLAKRLAEGGDVLSALGELAALETAWSRKLGFRYVSEACAQAQAILAEQAHAGVVVKELGAGGGDSFGIFHPAGVFGDGEFRSLLDQGGMRLPATSFRRLSVLAQGVGAEGYMGW